MQQVCVFPRMIMVDWLYVTYFILRAVVEYVDRYRLSSILYQDRMAVAHRMVRRSCGHATKTLSHHPNDAYNQTRNLSSPSIGFDTN
jgi:hypothetical protein